MDDVINSKKINIEEDAKTSNKLLNGIKESYYKFYKLFADNYYIGCIKKTIIMLIPVILIGFILYFFKNLPIDSYQNYLTTSEMDGFLDSLISITIGNITIYFTVILTYKYVKDKTTSFPVMLAVIATAVMGVMILAGSLDATIGPKVGFEYLFLGILYSYFVVKVFTFFIKKFDRTYKVYTTEVKKTGLMILQLMIPAVVVIVITAFLKIPLDGFDVSIGGLVIDKADGISLLDFFAKPFELLFKNCNIEILNGLVYAFFVCLLMFFGVGIDTSLNNIKMDEIINPTFMNIFIFTPMILGFVLALLIFGRRKTDKIYGGIGTFPSSFSKFHVVHYSYPMLLNPMTLVPLLIIPLITTTISYFLFQGMNLEIVNESKEMSLIFLNAYELTDSGLAIIVQVINVAISGLIFLPFVLLNNYAKKRAFKDNVKHLYKKYIQAKNKNKDVTIFDFDFELGETAKILTTQLIKDIEGMKEVSEKVIEFNKKKDSMKVKNFETERRALLDKLKKQLKIKSYFQPIVGNHVDFNEEGKPTYFEIKGMECLMRWWYEDNYVIPPLALELARSAGFEYEINAYLWENMLLNIDRKKCKSFITFNISMNCLEKDSFIDDITGLFERYDMDPSGFVVEITEEDEFTNEDLALNKICELKEKGFVFAIDDYGAGQTSMKYFQTNAFELVKIDGDLVKKAKENEQVYDIIGNIRELGKRGQKYANIQFKVLCEFIEDKNSFERLKELKVDYYQGFLFGKAQEFDDIAANPMMVKGSQKHV